jgi:hypothetical protein
VESSENRQAVLPSATARRSVNLDIAGEEFMLQGHFSDWGSGLAFGPDLDRVRVRIALDATSARFDESSSPSLFSFHGREVKSLGGCRYRVVGTFSGPSGAKAMEMTLESPPGHTALIVLTFSAKKVDFGDGWHDLIANVVPFVEQGEEGPVRTAHAWLVTPPVATA